MSADAKAIRSCTLASDDPKITQLEHGPVGSLDVIPFEVLRAHVTALRETLGDVPCERSEISVAARVRHMSGSTPYPRISATVRLIVHGPRTRSPVLWQTGGIEPDLDAWRPDLEATLRQELRAVQIGEALEEPWTGTVVLDPWVASLLVHECIGHTSEADNYLTYAQPNGLTLGHRWTEAPLTVVDDPTAPNWIGSYDEDDEGQPAEPTSVVTDGVWTGLLHSRATAQQLSTPRSGNGRRVVRAAAAIPRMSVLTARPGDHSFERLVGEVEDGWYVSGSWGAGSAGRQFILRPTLARRIRGGRVQDEFLRRFELRGDKFSTIAAIDAIGDEAVGFDPAFGCEKDGQNDLPVSFGAPHLRLRGITLTPLHIRGR